MNAEKEQWEAIDRRFRNLVRRASRQDFLRRKAKLEKSDTSQSKGDTALDTSGERIIDGESQ